MIQKWRISKRSKSRPSRDWNKITPAGSVTRLNASKGIKTRSCPSSRTCWRTGKKRYVRAWLLLHVSFCIDCWLSRNWGYLHVTVCLITQTVVSLDVSDYLCGGRGFFFFAWWSMYANVQFLCCLCSAFSTSVALVFIINLLWGLCLPLKQNCAGGIKSYLMCCILQTGVFCPRPSFKWLCWGYINQQLLCVVMSWWRLCCLYSVLISFIQSQFLFHGSSVALL